MLTICVLSDFLGWHITYFEFEVTQKNLGALNRLGRTQTTQKKICIIYPRKTPVLLMTVAYDDGP